jgi:hypothetical protein
MHVDIPPGRPGAKQELFVNGIRYASGDPQPTGRDILRLAGFDPASDHILIALTRPGARSIGLDEFVDLAEPGREHFRAFHSDRIYTFTVDERGYEWGASTISEADLRSITGVPTEKGFVLERQGEPDRPISPGEVVDLAARGAERIRTVRRTFTIIVNAEKKQVEGPQISFDQLVKLAFKTPPTGENILITIDYGKGPPANPKGSLKPGQSVNIQDGMVFDVTATDRS